MEDILGVKGVYTLSNRMQYDATASFYENKLEILGFNDVMSHEMTLYTFNRAEELSDPVNVTFTPLESPLSKVARTVK